MGKWDDKFVGSSWKYSFFLFAIGRGRRNGRRWRVWRWAREISRRCGNVVVFFPLRRGAKEGKVSRFVLCIEYFQRTILSRDCYIYILWFIVCANLTCSNWSFTRMISFRRYRTVIPVLKNKKEVEYKLEQLILLSRFLRWNREQIDGKRKGKKNLFANCRLFVRVDEDRKPRERERSAWKWETHNFFRGNCRVSRANV